MAVIDLAKRGSDLSTSGDLGDIPTPALLIDPAEIERNYLRIAAALPTGTTVRFATKCNPDPIVLRALARLGCAFEAASAAEVELLASIGVSAAEILHTLPCRSARDLQASFALGVGRWSVDSESELEKLAKHAPGASVSVRLAVDDDASHWGLSRKFGVDETTAVRLIESAAGQGLSADSLSFHVGSQVTDVTAWARAIAIAGSVLDQTTEALRPSMLNIGGGFPVAYSEATPKIEAIGQSVASAVSELNHSIKLEAEPGRFIVAEAGTVITEVTGVSIRQGRQWVFLDVGAFNGLFEASPGGGALGYPISALSRLESEHETPSVLAGPSCDGDDTIGEAVMLPADLTVGDRLEIQCAGAYSTAYSTAFCGVPPLQILAGDSDGEGAVHVGGTDLYRVAWPGSDLFERAMVLEEQWFELSGFLEQDGLDGYSPYQAASTFIVVQSPDGDLLSVCRLISASARGFKTTNDFDLWDEGRSAFDVVENKKILEVGTMATHPAARGMGPTLDVIRGVIDVARRRNITHLLTSLDEGLFRVFTGPPLHMPCYPIGETKEYYGSPTVPGFGPIAEHERLLREHSPDLHEYLYEFGSGRPAV
jgi:ornithine decarboxylase